MKKTNDSGITKRLEPTGVDWRLIRDYPTTVIANRYNRFARAVRKAQLTEAGK